MGTAGLSVCTVRIKNINTDNIQEPCCQSIMWTTPVCTRLQCQFASTVSNSVEQWRVERGAVPGPTLLIKVICNDLWAGVSLAWDLGGLILKDLRRPLLSSPCVNPSEGFDLKKKKYSDADLMVMRLSCWATDHRLTHAWEMRDSRTSKKNFFMFTVPHDSGC